MTVETRTESTFEQPELVFGLVGPIGVDMTAVCKSLSAALKTVDYIPHEIYLTKEIEKIIDFDRSDIDCENQYDKKILILNNLRKSSGKGDIMSLFAISRIQELREKINSVAADIANNQRTTTPLPRTAFIIRQLKRSDETKVLRKVYGQKFIQISISISDEQQRQSVAQIISNEKPTLSYPDRDKAAQELIDRDKSEDGETFGQRLSETFHAGDVFINGSNDTTIQHDCQRFINAFFGMNSISPTIDEFGSFLAKAASLRSIDMSRQVGSAILSDQGDIISIGCNEVPKAGGGNYWCSDIDPQRDADRKYEANKLETSRIIGNFLEALSTHGSLTKKPNEVMDDPEFQEIVKKALISDITEFGRMTHAEMSAISDAARLGRSVCGATMYVTTFPCHNCAKHLIASGISRIVYIEPYPKSRASILHNDSLSHDPKNNEKVRLEHFHGISPHRFREVFEKGKRKDGSNRLKTWYEDSPKPMVADRVSSHVLAEGGYIRALKAALKDFASTDQDNKGYSDNGVKS